MRVHSLFGLLALAAATSASAAAAVADDGLANNNHKHRSHHEHLHHTKSNNNDHGPGDSNAVEILEMAKRDPVPDPDPKQSLLVVTMIIRPLTTTFTPPATCTENQLTQLASPGYQLWNNEPRPVAKSTFGDCYPKEFMNGYTSLLGGSSSIAPMMSPLICPKGWHTAKIFDDGYIACCESGYELAPPTSTEDKSRPAYGGTCYSNFKVGQTVTVTAYDSKGVTGTVDWVASSTADQAYGHVIEGFALDLVSPSSTATSDSTSEPTNILKVTGAAPTGDSSLQDNNDADTKTSTVSPGVVAGAVVGGVAGLALILTAIFVLFRRRRQAERAAGSPQQQTRDLPPPGYSAPYGRGGPSPTPAMFAAAKAQGYNQHYDDIGASPFDTPPKPQPASPVRPRAAARMNPFQQENRHSTFITPRGDDEAGSPPPDFGPLSASDEWEVRPVPPAKGGSSPPMYVELDGGLDHVYEMPGNDITAHEMPAQRFSRQTRQTGRQSMQSTQSAQSRQSMSSKVNEED